MLIRPKISKRLLKTLLQVSSGEDSSGTLLTGDAGKFVSVEGMITDRIKLDDVVAKGFEKLVQGDPSSVKVLVSPK